MSNKIDYKYTYFETDFKIIQIFNWNIISHVNYVMKCLINIYGKNMFKK
jgi:hypothetical protein